MGPIRAHREWWDAAILGDETVATGYDEILSKGRKKKVVARSLHCFRAARELALSVTELARNLEMTVPGIGYAVRRGEKMAWDNHYGLV